MTSEAFEKYEVSNKWSARKRIGLLILGFVILIVLAAFSFAMFSGDKEEEATNIKDTDEEDNDNELWDEEDYDDDDFDPDDDEFDY